MAAEAAREFRAIVVLWGIGGTVMLLGDKLFSQTCRQPPVLSHKKDRQLKGRVSSEDMTFWQSKTLRLF